MKNVLYYYYHFSNTKIYKEQELYKFSIDNINYVFFPFYGNYEDASNIYYLSNNLLDNRFHKIILNINKQILTKVDNKFYIMLKINNNSSEKVNLAMLKDFIYINRNKYIEKLIRLDWPLLWGKKIYYFEYQLNHLEDKYPLIAYTINYYIGMGENAISYINDTLIDKSNYQTVELVIAHRRISYNYKIKDYYNPLNLVIDYKTRDISEYLKSLFIEDKYDLKNIEEFIIKLNFNKFYYQLLFGRLLYPSFYFDLYEQIVDLKAKEKDLIKIIARSREYTYFLRDVYNIINKKVTINKIDWI